MEYNYKVAVKLLISVLLLILPFCFLPILSSSKER